MVPYPIGYVCHAAGKLKGMVNPMVSREHWLAKSISDATRTHCTSLALVFQTRGL